MANGYEGDTSGWGEDDSYLWNNAPATQTLDAPNPYFNPDQGLFGATTFDTPSLPSTNPVVPPLDVSSGGLFGTNPFGGGGSVPTIGNGSINTTYDPGTIGVLDPRNPGNVGIQTTGNGDTVNVPNTGPITPDPGLSGIGQIDQGNVNTGVPTGGGSSAGGIFDNGTPLPIPGITWPVALGATALLNNGIFGGGGGSIANLPSAVGNVVSNPVQSVVTTGQNIGNSITGANDTTTIPPIVIPGNNQGGTSSGTTTPTQGQSQGGGTDIIPIPPQVSTPQPTTVSQVPSPPPPQNPTTPQIVPVPTPTTTTAPRADVPSPPPPLVPAGSTPSTPSTPTTPETQPTPPIAPIVTPPTGSPTTVTPGPVIIPPIIPATTTTMPTTTVDPRTYQGEGLTSATGFAAPGGVGQTTASNYGTLSPQYSATDFQNFQSILNSLIGGNGMGGANSTFTNGANAQTAASNTALRSGNLSDVSSLFGGALATNQAANQPLYNALNSYTGTAQNTLNQVTANNDLSGALSAQDLNTANQAANQAWNQRGLVMSPGAVGSSILNTNALQLQRQQQAEANILGAQQGYGSAVAAQQANAFNPFSTILGSQYGQQTNNAGSNNSLYAQTGALSSGALGNQNVNSLTDPYNVYSQDLYGQNSNAQLAQNISAGNNAAAMTGANTLANQQLLNSLIGGLSANGGAAGSALYNGLFGTPASGTNPGTGGLAGTIGSWLTCWVARSVFGADNPKWVQFRHWMLNIGPKWFRTLYLKHGEKFALWLDRNPWAKPPIRAFMESRIASMKRDNLQSQGGH